MALHRVCSWDESADRRFRYWLEAAVELAAGVRDKGICLFLMLNPNKADWDRSDATIDRCKELAHEWGCGTLWVCNLFPVRGGNFKALPPDLMGPDQPESSGFDGCALCRDDALQDLHINDRHILEASRSADIVVCAWGGKGGFDGRGREVAGMIVGAGYGDRLHTFGLTKVEKQPRHAKPQRQDQKLKSEDLRPWTDVERWLTEGKSR